jgi:hypothetical protein
MMPGDFSRIVPHGMALSVTPILRPWDDPVQAMSIPDYYGLEPVRMDPLGAAPLTDALGGVIYFDQARPQEWLDGAFSCMGVHLDERDNGVFQGQSSNFMRDRYLDQVRIASKRALGHLFGSPRFRPSRSPSATPGRATLTTTRSFAQGQNLNGHRPPLCQLPSAADMS